MHLYTPMRNAKDCWQAQARREGVPYRFQSAHGLGETLIFGLLGSRAMGQ